MFKYSILPMLLVLISLNRTKKAVIIGKKNLARYRNLWIYLLISLDQRHPLMRGAIGRQ